MEIFKTMGSFLAWRRDKNGTQASLGFVPTMGALHPGHMKLVEASKARNTRTVVSIFVNPLQFGAGEDLARYPRPFESDARLCREAGVDALFAPEPKDFYAPDHRTYCQVD